MKKVLFILGTARSGSTLLDSMLANSPNGLSVGELFALFRPWRPHHRLLSLSCFCNIEGCNFWSQIKKGGEKKVYYNIFQKIKDLEFIVDSSKSLQWFWDQLRYNEKNNCNLEFIPIIIFKTPIEFAYSLYKRDNLNIKLWKSIWIKTHLSLFYILDHFITVKYKDLALNPSSKLRELCEKIGIDYFNGKENFWQNNSTHLLFGSDTLRNSRRGISYQNQYNKKKLDFIKENLIMDNKMTAILSVLEGYEISSINRENLLLLKESIKELPLFDYVRGKLRITKYYWFNFLFDKIDIVLKKWVFDRWDL